MAKLIVYVNDTDTPKIISVETGRTLLSAMQEAGIAGVEAHCGGNGRCGKCRVRAEGSLSPMDMPEYRLLSSEKGFRLACMTKVAGDSVLHVDKEHSDVAVNWEMRGNELSESESRKDMGVGIGAAVDIGTTTVVLYLKELGTGELLAVVGGMNRQNIFGADVISRVQYCMENSEGLSRLTGTIRKQVVEYLDSACREAGREILKVQEITVAGNTIMEHIFAGVSPNAIALPPFKPDSLFGECFPAVRLGLPVEPNVPIYLAPCVSGYVGGDITAGLYASGAYKSEKPCVFIDIGTNGEIVLGNKDGFICCATAAGPAFEGAEITCGLPGVSGAVSHIWLQDGEVRLRVIGDGVPKGICGSGLVDALSMLLKIGGIDKTGRLLTIEEAPAVIRPYLGIRQGKIVFYLDYERDVFISEDDVRKLQLAKAAIAAGIQTLLSEAGLKEGEVEALYLAGGFGNYMDKDSAAAIGLIPKAFISKAATVGNSAGMGAVAALMSTGVRDELEEIRKRCKYVELSDSNIFSEYFIRCMMFETHIKQMTKKQQGIMSKDIAKIMSE